MGSQAKAARLAGIDAARGIAISLMILSHTVKALLAFKQMPDWGIVPVHLVTKFSSSLFILVFGVSVAVIYLPKVGTHEWPSVRWKLIKRAVLVMFWYKVLSVVQMFERSDPEVIVETLLFKRFPDFVEVLQFYGWFLLVLPLILPTWRLMGIPGRVMMAGIFGMLSNILREEFDFWGVWQLAAVFVEQDDVFCFGLLTRGTMAMGGMLLAEILVWGDDRERQRYIFGGTCMLLAACFAVAFYASEALTLADTFARLARNWGKHPPNLPFITFTFAGALAILGACMLAPKPVLWLLQPFVLLGRESLFCFNLHILVIFLVYRHHLGLRREVTYPEALMLTAVLIGVAVLAAFLYNALKRRLRGGRGEKAKPAGKPDRSAKLAGDAWVWGDVDDDTLSDLAGRPTDVRSARGARPRR